jgi:type II secretory pathway component PulK
MCLFVIALTSLLVVAMLDTQTAQLAAVRNTTDYERALYLAGAAVHHALAELEQDISWRSTVTSGSYPANGSYSATAVNGTGSEITVTGIGVSGGVTRTLQVTVGEGS